VVARDEANDEATMAFASESAVIWGVIARRGVARCGRADAGLEGTLEYETLWKGGDPGFVGRVDEGRIIVDGDETACLADAGPPRNAFSRGDENGCSCSFLRAAKFKSLCEVRSIVNGRAFRLGTGTAGGNLAELADSALIGLLLGGEIMRFS
jgi:hypothetical protein